MECQRILDAEFSGTFNLLFNQCLSFYFFNNKYALILYVITIETVLNQYFRTSLISFIFFLTVETVN